MHITSMHNMRLFKERYSAQQKGTVVDVGSLDVNGTYRDLFPGWDYIGIDIVPGNGVDLVLEDPHEWNGISDACADAIISGQAFEHIEDDVAVMREIVRALKPGGYCCIIAPSTGPMHIEPDYRRYAPDAMRNLAESAGLEVISAEINGRHPWYDCILIARKPASVFPAQAGIQNEEPNETKPRKRISKAD